jgi:hypothetical protein
VRPRLRRFLALNLPLTVLVAFTLVEIPAVADYPTYVGLTSRAALVSIDPSWTLEYESLTSGLLCAGWDIPCNSLNRKYTLPAMMSKGQFLSLSDHPGWNLKTTGTCKVHPDAVDTEELCYSTGDVDGYRMRILAVHAVDTDTYSLHVGATLLK